MIKPSLPQRWPRPTTISYYAMAVLSVAVAIVAAELITRLLHAEAIASSMLCAVIFTAWFAGFFPALLAVALALLAFHYYVVPPINSFVWKPNVLILHTSELPRLILFSITSVLVASVISGQRKATEDIRRAAGDLKVALEGQKRIAAALLRSEMHLTEAQKAICDVAITLDRDLLNRAVDSILHLEHGKLTLYSGSYDRFVEAREPVKRAATRVVRSRAPAKRASAGRGGNVR